MKIRNGFVSNSSSSSFVILLPPDFDIDKLDYSNADVETDAELERLKYDLKECIKDTDYYTEYSYQIYLLLKDYTIATIESGADVEGGITILSVKDPHIRNIFEGTEKVKETKFNIAKESLNKSLEDLKIKNYNLGFASNKFFVYLQNKLTKVQNRKALTVIGDFEIEYKVTGKISPA